MAPNTKGLTWNTPAMLPPKGTNPNFFDPPSLKDAIIIVNAVGVSLMVIVFLIRLYSKKVISRQKFDWSDVTCCLAITGSMIHTILTIYDSFLGFGRHMWDIRLLNLTPETTRLFSFVEVIYVITIYFVKISLLLLFWQFFQHDDMSRRMIVGGLGVCTIISVPYLIVASLHVSQCNGMKALSIHYCEQRQITISNLVFATLNVITDFYVLAVPISQLRTLQVTTKKKIGVMATFTTGFIASSMSIVRLAFIAHDIHNKDVLHTGAFMAILGTVEIKLAIICGCVVYLPAFLKQGQSSLSSAYGYLHRSKTSQNGASLKDKDPFVSVEAVQRPSGQSSQPAYDQLELRSFQTGLSNV